MSDSNDDSIFSALYTETARNGAIAGAIGGAISGIVAGIVVGLFVCCCYDVMMPKRKAYNGIYTDRG